MNTLSIPGRLPSSSRNPALRHTQGRAEGGRNRTNMAIRKGQMKLQGSRKSIFINWPKESWARKRLRHPGKPHGIPTSVVVKWKNHISRHRICLAMSISRIQSAPTARRGEPGRRNELAFQGNNQPCVLTSKQRNEQAHARVDRGKAGGNGITTASLEADMDITIKITPLRI